MKIWDLARAVDSSKVGEEMYRCVENLFPLCRSITGEGLRETLRRLGRLVPLTMHEVPTGTAVFDWTVPREWSIRDAYVKDAGGRRVIDFTESNLHVVHYSVPIHARLSLAALRPHLFTLPGRPDPPQKEHQFALRSLTTLTSYQVTPTAVNAAGLVTVGGTTTFTTL